MPVGLIAADAPFVPALAGWLAARYGDPGLRAEMRVWLPTARSGQVLAKALGAHRWGLLPDLRTLAVDEAQARLLGIHDGGQPVADGTAALVEMAEFWRRRREGVSATVAMRLAGDFLGLAGRLARARTGWRDVAAAVPEALADHWKHYAEDLAAAGAHYEGWLRRRGERSGAAAGSAFLGRLKERYEGPLPAPVVMAGITDLTPAAEDAARALVENPDGWVVLPRTARALRLAERLGGAVEEIPAAEMVAERRVIEARDPLEEARAIAAAVRESLHEGRTVAVVAADRDVSRRVQAVLTAQGLRAADSAGTPLNEAVAGRLLLALMGALAAPGPEAMAVFCAQPLLAPFDGWRAAAERLEALLWRGLPARNMRGWREKWRGLRHRDGAQAAAPAWEVVDGLWRAAPQRRQGLEAWAAFLLSTLDALAPGWREAEGGAAVVEMLAGLRGEASAETVAALLAQEAGQRKVPTAGAVAGVYLWGEQEARLQQVGTLILAGCNEGAWPPVVHDPWLSQAQLGMLGLTDNAHRAAGAAEDWELMAACCGRIVYSRGVTASGGVATVPSRYLLPLLQMPEAKAWRDAGRRYVEWARAQNGEAPVAIAPSAFVPEAPPGAWSATFIGVMRECPYHALAERVLKIAPLPPFHEQPDQRALGLLLHEWLEGLYRTVAGMAPPEETARGDAAALEAHLLDLGARLMEDQPEALRRLWQVRLPRLAAAAAAQTARDHRAGWRVEAAEMRAARAVGGIEITAKVDRLDMRGDVRRVVDYKTGAVPQALALKRGDKPQLPLEGWLVERATGAAGAGEFWKVKGYGDDPLEVLPVKDADWRAAVDAVPGGLDDMLNRFGAGRDWPAWPDMAEGGLRASGHCERCALAGVCRFKDWAAS